MAKKNVDPADAKKFSANEMLSVGSKAFDIGMKILLEFRGADAVFVTREVDPENGDVTYVFTEYERYRLVKDES